MANATLALTTPEETWLDQLSVAFPETRIEVHAVVPNADAGFALVVVSGPGVDGVLEAVADHPRLAAPTVVTRRDEEATVHFESADPFLLSFAGEATAPVDLPLVIQDGEATVDASGSREQLADFLERLDRAGVGYRITDVREDLHERQLLSDRQLEVIRVAVEEGYYDTPRRCSLTDLADRLGIAKSTCSETLHRAEEAVVKRFVAGVADVETDVSLADRLHD